MVLIKQLKPVIQYSKDGVFLKEYYSMKHASRNKYKFL
jgi:hypothetical protein